MVLGWLFLGLETGLRGALSFRVGSLAAAPSFVIPLAVYIAVCAPAQYALWSCLGLGLAIDLLTPFPTDSGTLTVIGPHALGFLIAGQFVLAVRGLVLRRNPVTVLALSIPAAAIVNIVVVAILTARHLVGDSIAWEPSAQLGARMLGSLLTGVTGLVIGLVLMPLAPALGLYGGPARRR